MSALIIDEEVVHYEVLGRGRPLIFVHGWLGSWRYWIPTMQALSAEGYQTSKTFEGADLVISTGCYGYVSERTFSRRFRSPIQSPARIARLDHPAATPVSTTSAGRRCLTKWYSKST